MALLFNSLTTIARRRQLCQCSFRLFNWQANICCIYLFNSVPKQVWPKFARFTFCFPSDPLDKYARFSHFTCILCSTLHNNKNPKEPELAKIESGCYLICWSLDDCKCCWCNFESFRWINLTLSNCPRQTEKVTFIAIHWTYPNCCWTEESCQIFAIVQKACFFVHIDRRREIGRNTQRWTSVVYRCWYCLAIECDWTFTATCRCIQLNCWWIVEAGLCF